MKASSKFDEASAAQVVHAALDTHIVVDTMDISANNDKAGGGPVIDLSKPRWDQSTFEGRAKHFFVTTNPLNVLASSAQLDEAKQIVESYRSGTLTGKTEDEIWNAKFLYDSAFHPDTKEKMFILGRMSAQVPCNMTITGCMMTFYRTTPAVVFWQWINQTFNAIVNYTNRSGDTPISMTKLGQSYMLATGGALATALSLKASVTKLPPIFGKLVPFAAVAGANCINIPFMRMNEMEHGIQVQDADGNVLTNSTAAAKSAIAQVVFSRVGMAMPGMVIPPIMMVRLERNFLKKHPKLAAPIQVAMVGLCLVFATPLCCALFPQQSSMLVKDLEPEAQDRILALPNPPTEVFFNKGL